MVNRDANIDLLFRNGLSDFEALPPGDVWEGIRPVIDKPKRSFTSLKIAASVAVLIVSGLLTVMLVSNLSSSIADIAPAVASEPGPSTLKNDIKSGPGKLIAYQSEPGTGVPEAVIAETSSPLIQNHYFSLPEAELYKSFITDSRTGVIERAGRSISIQKASNNSFSDFASTAEVQKPSQEGMTKENKWSVGAMITPAYYSHFSLSDNDAAHEITKSEQAAFSYTGGLTFAYNLSSRFTVQTGLNYSSIGQKIDGVSSYSGFGKFVDSKGESQFGVMTSSGTITSKNSDLFLTDNNAGARVMTAYSLDVFDPVKNELSYISNSLTQNFNYIELPVILKYKVIDRSIDLKVIGGVSYNILVSNTAYSTSGGERFIIGKTDGLSPVTLSSSLGMGMEYSFSNKLSLSLEPTFRYYITSTGGLVGSSIHPYSFGILSGISYKF